jgi:hypothetical protein
LNLKTCTCGMFSEHGYPCKHAFHYLDSNSRGLANFVSAAYRIESLRAL